jgi:dnd system-associated protein 4
MARAANIRRSRVHEELVQSLAGEKGVLMPNSGKKMFPTLRELLSFCAMLGFSDKRRKKLDPAHGYEDISGTQYEHSEAIEILWAIAVAEVGSTDILKDGRERDAADIFEEYANGGLEIISSWILNNPTVQPYQAIIDGLEEYNFISLSENIGQNGTADEINFNAV